MKQKWSLQDPMVDLFEKIEEGLEFAEAANNPTPGEKLVNISYLIILKTGGMEKSCEQWEDMQVGLKTWKAFKYHFTQAYRRYQICNNVMLMIVRFVISSVSSIAALASACIASAAVTWAYVSCV